jgi:Protein of unknown function, DUF417
MVARTGLEPYPHLCLRPRCGNCAFRVVALSPSVASATGGSGWIPGIPDVVRDTLLSHYNAGVLDTGPRRRQPRLPFLSGAGRLVVKNSIMMGAALVVMADSAKVYFAKAWRLRLTTPNV